jgi:hypothetical protein
MAARGAVAEASSGCDGEAVARTRSPRFLASEGVWSARRSVATAVAVAVACSLVLVPVLRAPSRLSLMQDDTSVGTGLDM